MKKCKHCGKEFEPKNPKGKFCSDKCRVYASRAVKSEKPIIDYTPQLPATSAENSKKFNEAFQEAFKKQLPKPKNLQELKELCPFKEFGDERSAWIATERQKYGI